MRKSTCTDNFNGQINKLNSFYPCLTEKHIYWVNEKIVEGLIRLLLRPHVYDMANVVRLNSFYLTG